MKLFDYFKTNRELREELKISMDFVETLRSEKAFQETLIKDMKKELDDKYDRDGYADFCHRVTIEIAKNPASPPDLLEKIFDFVSEPIVIIKKEAD